MDVLFAFGAICCVAWSYIADAELREFVTGKTEGKVLDTGLWSISRHPNYLGESTFHWMIGGWAVYLSGNWLMIVGGLFNSFILIISAKLQEDYVLSGKRAKLYKEYCKRTRMFL